MTVLPTSILFSAKKRLAPSLAGLVALVSAVSIAMAGVLALPTNAEAKYAAYIIDANSGKELHAVNADTRNYPASLTKIMTLYLMFEAIDKGRMNLDDRIVFSRRAARQPSSKLGLKAGQSLSVEDAILALAVKSANDVASAVAEHMGGTERKFALKMTAKARQLGMTRTTFRNASGLPHRAQLSTARDMATLARAMIRDFPHRYGYFSETRFRHNGKIHKTHNSLLTSYEGTDGIKTGYIRASGFQLVTSVKRGKQRLIGVVFGGKTAKVRNKHMTALLNKSFARLDAATAGKTVAKAKAKTKTNAKTPVEMVWGVQVGVYRHKAPAKDMALRAIDVVPELLAEGRVTISPLKQKSGRVLYRARIVGFEKRVAFRACKALERQRLDCMEFQSPAMLEVAMR